jgi:hypothetical protein
LVVRRAAVWSTAAVSAVDQPAGDLDRRHASDGIEGSRDEPYADPSRIL